MTLGKQFLSTAELVKESLRERVKEPTSIALHESIMLLAQHTVNADIDR